MNICSHCVYIVYICIHISYMYKYYTLFINRTQFIIINLFRNIFHFYYFYTNNKTQRNQKKANAKVFKGQTRKFNSVTKALEITAQVPNRHKSNISSLLSFLLLYQ